tara:strand:+ start:107 stop:526 length:420 start_codon:yes stop_codon:yes gene_type:complete
MNLNLSNYDIEVAAQDWRDNQLADYLAEVDFDSDAKIFDEKSDMLYIVDEMSMEREVAFQPSWAGLPTVYTVTDVIADRLEWGNEDEVREIAKCFGAAMYNEDKGGLAVEIAQDAPMHQWVSDFFKLLQENVPDYLVKK